MAANTIARIKELGKERAQLVSSAKKEALERAQAAIADLGALGFAYRLEEESNATRRRTRRGTRRVKNAPCPVCKFLTVPPHDARKHRGQGKRKRPFTAAQLKRMGLEKA